MCSIFFSALCYFGTIRVFFYLDPFLLVKKIHSIIYLFMMLQGIYICKGKHFDRLAVENYVDKDSTYCFFLCSSLLPHDPIFFLLFEPLPVGVIEIHYHIFFYIAIVDLL